jgi:hypothetical protein
MALPMRGFGTKISNFVQVHPIKPYQLKVFLLSDSFEHASDGVSCMPREVLMKNGPFKLPQKAHPMLISYFTHYHWCKHWTSA